MRLYLDLCCLKRPFDDGTIPRIRLEAEAVVAIEKAIESGVHDFVRSIAHDLENAQDPDAVRRARVDELLARHTVPGLAPAAVTPRTQELLDAGFGAFDARHLAWAEALGAQVFLTTDDRLRSRAGRQPAVLKIRVLGPLDFVQEVDV